MLTRGELTAQAMVAGSQLEANQFIGSQIANFIRSTDMLVVLAFSVIGLTISLVLMLLMSFSPDIASGLAQLS